ncbi:hypothetical protein [Paenibacillus cineris]|uniref:hypothetical protein n=1 Tax=Paenibacillus cineris TaxID=237530 RepID=UPI001B291BB4|nr:hypothetical protein [Paenibacillus cineris]GIO63054.1 hypothetical protein J43TS9_46280 [Paenibacillus cineris]
MIRQLRRPAALLATIAGTATILLWMKLGNAKKPPRRPYGPPRQLLVARASTAAYSLLDY